MKATPAALPRAMFLSVSVRSSTFPRRRVSPWPGSVFRIGAEADLFNIGLYTFRTWGEIQTDRYIRQLEDCCQLLADNPALGRPCDEIRPGLRRMKQGKHVVFYREELGGILISRILHQSMLPEKQAFDDEDDTPDSP
jgi:toxin ParE1/3/4